MDDLNEVNGCVTCKEPVGIHIAYCWPCYHNIYPADQRPKNMRCSLCDKNKRGTARYCGTCEAKIYPTQKEIETALVELQRWIS
jgi:hypothetical protein